MRSMARRVRCRLESKPGQSTSSERRPAGPPRWARRDSVWSWKSRLSDPQDEKGGEFQDELQAVEEQVKLDQAPKAQVQGEAPRDGANDDRQRGDTVLGFLRARIAGR